MANFSMRTLIKSTHESAHSNMRPSATVSTFQLLFLASLISILHHPVCADPPYNNCSSTSNFTSNSKFQSNLLQLLDLLNSQSSNSSFHYTYFGEDPDRVYGNFLCYSYVSRDNCKRSLLSAIQDIQMRCPTSKEAITWEEYCQLRYSDKSFSGLMDYTTNLTLFNYKNISDPDLFKVVVKQMLGNLSKQAAFDSSGKMYALGQSGFGKIDKVYGLVQCTEDLSGRDCYTCLQNAISAIQSCCYFYRGARVLARSCFLRYELYPLLESGTSSSSNSSRNSNRKKLLALIIVTIAAAIVLAALLCFCVYYHVKRRRAHRVEQAVSLNSLGVSIRDMYQPDMQGRDLIETTEFPLISYATLCSATNNFSSSNILGEGGFGPVYKGKLPDGREVAVKTLSCISEQGSEEFMNEVLLIMKLQHKNLVRLLGCCVEGDEKVLVYEYMPNGSLDVLLFDEQRRAELDWGKRFNIVIGIARGLLYLHQDSRLRIIHRDLKASNILLDNHINPKISDFGMARIFGGTLGEANTCRIVGTYGYMAPEYAMEGLYSIKSDVFSFGVLLLEMVTGKKNAGFHLSRRAPSLLVYAWELWTEGRGLELIDSLLSESYSTVEFLRCIHIGLLCVQEDAADRPTMSSVVIMLQSESSAFPPPKQPASSGGRVAVKLDQSQNFSINNLIASSVSPR